ncbi:MAG: Ig-like domain-containing protein [Myxococcota bacterium]
MTGRATTILLLWALGTLGCEQPAPDARSPDIPEVTLEGTDTQSEDSSGVEVAQVILTASMTVLQVDRTLNLTVEVFDTDGAPVEDPPIRFISSAPDIATVDASGQVVAVSAGEVVFTAEVDGLQSAPWALNVVGAPDFGDPSLRILDARVVVAVDESVWPTIQVRDARGVLIEPGFLTWNVEDEGLVEGHEAHLTGRSVGETWATVSWRGAESDPVPVVVTDQERLLSVTRIAPMGPVVIDQQLTLQWAIERRSWRWSDFGEPVMADRVEVIDHRTGEIIAEADLAFGEAELTIDATDWSSGAHLLRARAWVGDDIADEAPVQVTVAHTSDEALAANLLGDPADGSRQSNQRLRAGDIDLFVDGASPWLASFHGKRVRVGRWDESTETWEMPSGRTFTRDNRDEATIRDQFSWGSTHIDTRSAPSVAIDGTGRPVVAYVGDDDAHGTNPDYWDSIFVARWDGGADGAWTVLTEGDPGAVYNSIGESDPLTEPVESDRATHAASPRLLIEPSSGTPLVALLSSDVRAGTWSVEVRRWRDADGRWEDYADAVPVSLAVPKIRAAEIDDDGVVHVSVVGMSAHGRQSVVATMSPTAVQRAEWDGAALVGAGNIALVEDGGDLRVLQWNGADWTPRGVLDHNPWANAWSGCLARRDETRFATWLEGPVEQPQLRAAFWRDTEQRFVEVDAPIRRQLDGPVSAARCAVDDDGHGMVAWTEQDLSADSEQEHLLFLKRFSAPLPDSSE